MLMTVILLLRNFLSCIIIYYASAMTMYYACAVTIMTLSWRVTEFAAERQEINGIGIMR